jgi:hypothetical protein
MAGRSRTLGNRSSPAIASHADAPQRTRDQRLNLPKRSPPCASVSLDVLRGFEPDVSQSYHNRFAHLPRIARYGFVLVKNGRAYPRSTRVITHPHAFDPRAASLTRGVDIRFARTVAIRLGVISPPRLAADLNRRGPGASYAGTGRSNSGLKNWLAMAAKMIGAKPITAAKTSRPVLPITPFLYNP